VKQSNNQITFKIMKKAEIDLMVLQNISKTYYIS